jgi:hypothetical protein
MLPALIENAVAQPQFASTGHNCHIAMELRDHGRRLRARRTSKSRIDGHFRNTPASSCTLRSHAHFVGVFFGASQHAQTPGTPKIAPTQ